MIPNFVLTFVLSMAFIGVTKAGVIPAAVAAEPIVVAPAAIAYSKAVPYNIPPHGSRVDITTKALAPIIATAPIVAASAPVVAPSVPIFTPSAAAPIFSGYPFLTYPPFTSPFVIPPATVLG